MPLDVSPLANALPLFGFLIVFILVYAVLYKTKLVDHWFFQILIAFLVAIVFVVSVGARTYVEQVVPWVGVLLVCLFFVLLILGFMGKDVAFLNKSVGILFIVLLLIILAIPAFFTFPSFFERFSDSRWSGAVILVVVAALVAWALIRLK